MSQPGSASASIGKRNLLTNAAVNGLGFATAAVTAFVMSPLLVHGLGDRRYGAWSLVESIVAYLTLFDLGIGAAVLRMVAKFEEIRDRERLNRVFSASLFLFACAGGLALAIALGLALPWPRPLGVPEDLAEETRWLLVLLGANLAWGLPLSVYAAALDGLGRYPMKTGLQTAMRLVQCGLFLLVLRAGGDLRAIAGVAAICGLAQHLSLALAAHYYLPGLRFSWRLIDRETLRNIRGYSTYSFIAMIAGRLSFKSDALVIGALLSPQNITFFMVAARLVDYARDAIRSVTSVLTPAVSAWEARGDHAAIRNTLLRGTRYVLLATQPIQLGLLLLGYSFLSLWMGPRYADLSFVTLCILALPLPLALSQSVTCRILYGTGTLKTFTALAVGQAVCNVTISLALAVPLGIEGVALGTSIPSVVHSLILAVYICRVVKIAPAAYFTQSFVKPLLAAVLLAAVWGAARTWARPMTWSEWTGWGACGMAIYVLFVVLLEVGPRKVVEAVRGMMSGMALDSEPQANAR